MPITDLPAELLTQIFEIAVEDNFIYNLELPTCMALSKWDDRRDEWVLVDPMEAMYIKQRYKYRVTKSIIFTCRRWYQLAYHLLFHTVFLQDPSRLPPLCLALDRHVNLGWHVRRLHLVRFYAPRGLTLAHVAAMLASVIHQCPNLALCLVEWSLANTFSDIASALSTYSARSLRAPHINITQETLPRLIWVLESLPQLVSAHIEFNSSRTYPAIASSSTSTKPQAESPESPEQPDTTPHLGAASQLSLTLPCLRQLTLRGNSQTFVEEATGWSLPALQAFSLDFMAGKHDLPDASGFLTAHGSTLLFLDLNTIPALDVAAVLSLCPLLNAFCFNPDWRLPFHNPPDPEDPEAPVPGFVDTPHPNIRFIGLHQLTHALLPKAQSPRVNDFAEMTTILVQRANDLTFQQLNKTNFPQLEIVRVLNRSLLACLERNDGPEKGEGLARWERWYDQCVGQGVRLEDCTGALLGTLPGDEEEEKSEEEYAYADVEEEGETVMKPDNVGELRELLEDIRRMNIEEPAPAFPAMAMAMGVGMGMGMPGMPGISGLPAGAMPWLPPSNGP